jgi:predicted membrane protein
MKKRYKVFSLICLIVCIIVWIPNIVFDYPTIFILLTFIVGPIGAIFAYLARNKLLLFSNIIGALSFFIIMFVGNLIYALDIL